MSCSSVFSLLLASTAPQLLHSQGVHVLSLACAVRLCRWCRLMLGVLCSLGISVVFEGWNASSVLLPVLRDTAFHRLSGFLSTAPASIPGLCITLHLPPGRSAIARCLQVVNGPGFLVFVPAFVPGCWHHVALP